MIELFAHISELEEKPLKDTLGYAGEIDHVKSRLDRLVKKGRHSIVAYLGPFGVGKSTILREVKKQTNTYRWIHFEMWRYSNRNELWDAFVIKLASELTKGKDEFEIADQVEGSELSRKEWFLLGLWVVVIGFTFSVLSLITWLAFKDALNIGAQFGEAYFKYAIPTIFPVLVLIGLGRFLQLNFITSKRPLRRVFELENLLMVNIKKLKTPLIVVVEDADRAGSDGAVFLETLNYFLGRLSEKAKPFIVIAPQSARVFERLNNQSYEGIETALKIYDEKIYFNSAMYDESIARFYEELGTDPVWKKKLITATQGIVGSSRNILTVRLLKHALREMVQFVEMNPNTNPVIALSIILSRYVEISDGTGNNMQLAIRTLDGGRQFGSREARQFFEAIAYGISLEKGAEARSVESFVLDFDSTSQPSALRSLHKNGTSTMRISVAGIYKYLII